MATLTKEEFAKAFAKNLKEIHSFHTIGNEAIAEICDMTQPQISNYENGKSIPTLYSAYRLAKCYGISIDDLIKTNDK